ncbi:MAG: hypothetical protein ACK5LS_07315, partial [Propioniciclava sp.]
MSGNVGLGVDIGATTVRASIARRAGGRTVVAPLRLSANSPAMSAAVFVGEDGTLTVGDAALRAGRDDPRRLVGDLLHAVGSAVPHVVGGHRITAEA